MGVCLADRDTSNVNLQELLTWQYQSEVESLEDSVTALHFIFEI